MHLMGDPQGCLAALDALLQRVAFSPSRDHLVVLGDLVNRGPDSLGVLRRLRALEGAATCLLGNHDLHLLAVAAGARQAHPGDTLAGVLHAPDAPALLEWLRHRPLACQAAGWLCVHAGVPPAWDAADTLAMAGEVHATLAGPGHTDFLHQMSGNLPDHWAPDAQGWPRLRYAVNALTRMRYCHADGRLDVATKEGLTAAPAGLRPWFEMPQRRSADQPIAFGHWSTLGLINRPTLLALDTGCVWGGALTAVRVDGGRREVMQITCEQAQAPG